jgi:aminopeptidase-like protein
MLGQTHSGFLESLPDRFRTSPGIGHEIFALCERLWPLNRSLTGTGVRETLHILRNLLPQLKICEVPSGTKVFDWTVPDEWNVKQAWIETPDGTKIADFAEHNLHLVGYSVPVDAVFSLDELEPHLHSMPSQPDAIPYVTSYYARNWGFCLRDRDRKKLKKGNYRVFIDSTLEPGSLSYGELVIPGNSAEEIFLSTYVCHPSMANNELSGPCVTAYLARWISELPRRNYTYRIVFIPETIGSITYLSKHLDHLKRRVVAGFNVTCVGDDRCHSYLPSRNGATLADQLGRHVLKHLAPGFKSYSFLDRGSDERQYCAPGVDLPVASLMRSKFDEYPEYHTSLDNLTFISPSGLQGGYCALKLAIDAVENNCIPRVTTLCEPQLGRRGLYPHITNQASYAALKPMLHLIAYSDGTKSLLEIAELIGVPIWSLVPICNDLIERGVLVDSRQTTRQ